MLYRESDRRQKTLVFAKRRLLNSYPAKWSASDKPQESGVCNTEQQ